MHLRGYLSERGVICQEVQQLFLRKGNALRMGLPCALTEFYRFHTARSIADNEGKTDATLTLGRGGFCYAKQQQPCRKKVYWSSLRLFCIQYFRGIVTQERHRLSHLLYGRVVMVVMYRVVSNLSRKEYQIGRPP